MARGTRATAGSQDCLAPTTLAFSPGEWGAGEESSTQTSMVWHYFSAPVFNPALHRRK